MMKNQYVGDIGDFGKYSLLRAFSDRGIRVGVNWYLTEDDGSNDGKFTGYLEKGDLRKYSPKVFDALKKVVSKPDKSVEDIEKSGIISDAIFLTSCLNLSGHLGTENRRECHGFGRVYMNLKEQSLFFLILTMDFLGMMMHLHEV